MCSHVRARCEVRGVNWEFVTCLRNVQCASRQRKTVTAYSTPNPPPPLGLPQHGGEGEALALGHLDLHPARSASPSRRRSSRASISTAQARALGDEAAPSFIRAHSCRFCTASAASLRPPSLRRLHLGDRLVVDHHHRAILAEQRRWPPSICTLRPLGVRTQPSWTEFVRRHDEDPPEERTLGDALSMRSPRMSRGDR